MYYVFRQRQMLQVKSQVAAVCSSERLPVIGLTRLLLQGGGVHSYFIFRFRGLENLKFFLGKG